MAWCSPAIIRPYVMWWIWCNVQIRAIGYQMYWFFFYNFTMHFQIHCFIFFYHFIKTLLGLANIMKWCHVSWLLFSFCHKVVIWYNTLIQSTDIFRKIYLGIKLLWSLMVAWIQHFFVIIISIISKKHTLHTIIKCLSCNLQKMWYFTLDVNYHVLLYSYTCISNLVKISSVQFLMPPLMCGFSLCHFWLEAIHNGILYTNTSSYGFRLGLSGPWQDAADVICLCMILGWARATFCLQLQLQME